MIRDESTNSFNETKQKRKSQERQLLAYLLECEIDGATDAQISLFLEIPQALAAARRNGLAKTLNASQDEWKLISVGKTKSHESGRTVNVWGLVLRDEQAKQTKLFNGPNYQNWTQG